jgi:hypothetical protein
MVSAITPVAKPINWVVLSFANSNAVVVRSLGSMVSKMEKVGKVSIAPREMSIRAVRGDCGASPPLPSLAPIVESSIESELAQLAKLSGIADLGA